MGSVPIPRTFIAGETETAAYLNSLSSVLNFLLAPPKSKAYVSAAQSMPTGAYTVVTFDAESFDSDNMHSTSTNPDRLTFNTPGTYLVTAQLSWASNTTGVRKMNLIDPSGVQIIGEAETPPVATFTSTLQLVGLAHFNAGDYIRMQGWQNGASPLALAAGDSQTFLAAQWVSNL